MISMSFVTHALLANRSPESERHHITRREYSVQSGIVRCAICTLSLCTSRRFFYAAFPSIIFRHEQ